MIKDLDYTGIDLIVARAHLKLEQLKADFTVKPKPKLIQAPCLVCESRSNVRLQRLGGIAAQQNELSYWLGLADVRAGL